MYNYNNVILPKLPFSTDEYKAIIVKNIENNLYYCYYANDIVPCIHDDYSETYDDIIEFVGTRGIYMCAPEYKFWSMITINYSVEFGTFNFFDQDDVCELVWTSFDWIRPNGETLMQGSSSSPMCVQNNPIKNLKLFKLGLVAGLCSIGMLDMPISTTH